MEGGVWEEGHGLTVEFKSFWDHKTHGNDTDALPF